MPEIIFNKIRVLLDEKKVSYEHLQHEHVHSSQDAAKIRGTNIEQAAKALILKEKKSGELVMFIVGGDRRLDLKVIKKEILKIKNISLAPPEEILERTTCTIGSIPPFGNLFNIKTYFDEHLQKTQEYVVFSAGTHNDSIKMKTKDLLDVTSPIIAAYSSTATQ